MSLSLKLDTAVKSINTYEIIKGLDKNVRDISSEPCIYLYTKRKNVPLKDIPDTWYDMPVKVQRIGKIRPA